MSMIYESRLITITPLGRPAENPAIPHPPAYTSAAQCRKAATPAAEILGIRRGRRHAARRNRTTAAATCMHEDTTHPAPPRQGPHRPVHNKRPQLSAEVSSCWATKIRTWNDRTRICSVTITP